MIETRARIRGTRREMRAALKQLPQLIDGKRPDINGLGRTFKSYFAYFWFQKVREAYEIKSAGGTDDAGISWEKNSPETIARRGVREIDNKKIRGQRKSPLDERVRGLLTPAQDRLWRGIYRSNYLRLVKRTGTVTARATAAKIAWAMLKKMGAQTKQQVYGSRNLPIGRDTDRLIEACSPGSVSDYGYVPPSKDQEVTYRHGRMDFQIRVPYAAHFHSRRRIWPAAYKAQGWVQYAAHKALEATLERMKKLK